MNNILPLEHPSTMNNHEDEIIALKKQLEQVTAQKESMASQLEEALYLLSIKDEHIELLEKKAAKAVQLQSRLDEGSTETQSLRQMMADQQKKSAGMRHLKSDLEEELIVALQLEKKYLALQEAHFHTSNEILVLQAEVKELAEINKELLLDLEKLGEIQSRNNLLQLENNELKGKLM